MAHEGKKALLDRVTAYLAEAGVGDQSLRQIAAGAGTSHRMLIYHFGTRDQLLVEVVRAVERQQRAALADLSTATGSPRDLALAFWRRLSDPALAPHERLFFELYGAALAGRPGVAPVLDGIVDSWLDPVVGAFEELSPADRRRRGRMVLAFVRGALLDLLATGDREELDRVVADFVDLTFGVS